MGWLSILLLVVQYGPTIFNLVAEVVELLKKLRGAERDAYTAELKAAVTAYRQTKNRRPLRELRDRLQKRCFEG